MTGRTYGSHARLIWQLKYMYMYVMSDWQVSVIGNRHLSLLHLVANRV